MSPSQWSSRSLAGGRRLSQRSRPGSSSTASSPSRSRNSGGRPVMYLLAPWRGSTSRRMSSTAPPSSRSAGRRKSGQRPFPRSSTGRCWPSAGSGWGRVARTSSDALPLPSLAWLLGSREAPTTTTRTSSATSWPTLQRNQSTSRSLTPSPTAGPRARRGGRSSRSPRPGGHLEVAAAPARSRDSHR